MKTITNWKVQITWSNGTKEWLDYIPESKEINWYLDHLEHERYEQENYERDIRLESEELEKNKEENQ